MPKVKVGDINMYYAIHGEGEPLVLIPGLMGNTDFFFREIPVFSRDYRVIAFDNRGAGQTDAPDVPYYPDMFVNDLAGLLDAIGIKSAHICGGSMGGMIAQGLVLKYPEKVISLILQCTSCGGQPSTPTDPTTMQRLADAAALNPELRAKGTLRSCVAWEFAEKNPEIIQEYIAHMIKHPAPPQGGLRQLQAGLRGESYYERLPDIKVPTLIIHGESDQLIPVENARILASRIPNSELLIFKNTGHMLLESQDEIFRIMLDFLKRHQLKQQEA